MTTRQCQTDGSTLYEEPRVSKLAAPHLIELHVGQVAFGTAYNVYRYRIEEVS